MIVKMTNNGKRLSPASYSLSKKDCAGRPRHVSPMSVYRDADLTDLVIRYSRREQKYISGISSSGVHFKQLFPRPHAEIRALQFQYWCAGLPRQEFAFESVGRVDDLGRWHEHFGMGTNHLPTGRTISPYRHAYDAVAVRNLCRLINLQFALPDPEANPALTDPPPYPASKETREDHAVIDALVCETFTAGRVNSREDIIPILTSRGVQILKTYDDCLIIRVRPEGCVFRLEGRKYTSDFSRDRFVAAQRDAAIEQSRPLDVRISECTRRHAEHLAARHFRFCEAIFAGPSEAEPLTKGDRIARHRTTRAREQAFETIHRMAEKGPLGLDHYRFELPEPTLRQLRDMGVHTARESLECMPCAFSNISVAVG